MGKGWVRKRADNEGRNQIRQKHCKSTGDRKTPMMLADLDRCLHIVSGAQ